MTKSSKMTDKEWCFINYPLGIFSWFGFVLPFEERITLIKEAGFTATSIWWEDEVAPFPIKKESMPHLAREQGLLLENIHVPYNNSDALWSEHESLRKAIVQCHVEWLYDCAQFGIPMMVMHLNDEINPPAPNSQGLENMRELVQVAEKMQVTIAIENTRRNDNISYVLKSIRSNYLGFCFDSSHHRLVNNEDCRLLKEHGDRLVATPLSDNDGVEDRHWLPGYGIIDWFEVSRSFPRGYDGFLTLEVYPTIEERKDSPQKFLKKAYQKISDIQKLINNS